MNVVIAVAHPDDCVIFAWPIVNYKPEWTWEIVYLTYNATDSRAKEAQAFWHQYNIPTTFLGFEDHYRDLEQKKITTFDEVYANFKMQTALTYADLVVTHNPNGDYGHPHHILVSNAVTASGNPFIYFAGTDNFDLEITGQPQFDTAQWPLHREVIEGFRDRHIGRYYVGEARKKGIDI